MTDDTTDDFDVVAMNPAAFYTAPADVYEDNDLTHAQKLRLLEEWERDLARQLESDGEGMAQGPEENHADEDKRANDAAMLKQAANYRRKMADEKDKADKSTALGRVWRRLFSSDKKAA
jgi:hypothetical protein